MALPQGINFRATSGYVTDGANEDFELSATSLYPRTSAQGNTVGWENKDFVAFADNSSTVDRRLAGAARATDGGAHDYRVDLPSSGSYNVRIAAGNAAAQVETKIELFDTTSSLGVLCSGNTGASGNFKDAANTAYSAANWPGSNTAASKTFATTICRFRHSGSGNVDNLAHVYVESAGGGTSSFSYTASGGIVFSGASGVLRKRLLAAAGGLVFAGTSAMARVAARLAAGGIVFGGAATVAFHSAVRTVQAAGGIVFGGNSVISYVGQVASEWILRVRRRGRR